MGKIGRFACIITPMALTIASLVCLLLVFLGGLNKSSDILSDTYFFKADLSEFRSNPTNISTSDSDIDAELLSALEMTAKSDLEDIYTVGMWNYCSGSKDNSTDGFNLTYCSSRKSSYWFNPVEVWGLNDTAAEDLIPSSLEKGLKAYKKVATWMFAAYTIAFWATLVEIFVGIFALFSRWGSLVTTVTSGVSTFFTIAASATASALYGTLAGTFDSVLEPYNISASVGSRMMATTWLASAFSIAAGLFWFFSTCCCSGRSDRDGRKKVTVEKTPYTYERVHSPFGSSNNHTGNMPLRDMQGNKAATAYEPFRHDSRV